MTQERVADSWIEIEQFRLLLAHRAAPVALVDAFEDDCAAPAGQGDVEVDVVDTAALLVAYLE